MQELILIISRCVSKKKITSDQNLYYQFHFRGFYSGEKIKMVNLYSASDENLSKGDDYILWGKRVKVQDQILEVELIKYKKIT